MIDDLIRARAALMAFWKALSRDDDEAAAAVLFEPTRRRYGWGDSGLALRLRAALDVTVDECRAMSPDTPASRLEEGAVGFVCAPVGRGNDVDAGQLVLAMALVPVSGGWRVWGTITFDEFQSGELVELPPLHPWPM